MKSTLIVAAIVLGMLGGSVIAADMPMPNYKTPPLPVTPASNWSGFYVGGNAGYGWGDPGVDLAGNGTTISFPGPTGVPNSIAFADSQAQRLKGFIGGGQLGYSYQFNPKWVLGFEADIQGSGQRDNKTLVDPFSSTICNGTFFVPPVCVATIPTNGAAVTGYESKIEWFGTIRGRVGVLATDRLLVYGTGGLAYGQVSVSGNTTVNGATSFGPFATPGSSGFSASKTNVGFTVGGGVEGKFSYLLPAGWTWKMEYLYLDLGSLNAAAAFPAVLPAPFLSPATGALAAHARFADNIVRAGINYAFGN